MVWLWLYILQLLILNFESVLRGIVHSLGLVADANTDIDQNILKAEKTCSLQTHLGPHDHVVSPSSAGQWCVRTHFSNMPFKKLIE